MLKPSHLLTQGFENNRTAQENIFKHMCNFGARAEWREVRRFVSSYINVDTSVGTAEVLAKMQMLGVIKKQLKLGLKCCVLTLSRWFSHEGIRCYSFSSLAVDKLLTPNNFRWCQV